MKNNNSNYLKQTRNQPVGAKLTSFLALAFLFLVCFSYLTSAVVDTTDVSLTAGGSRTGKDGVIIIPYRNITLTNITINAGATPPNTVYLLNYDTNVTIYSAPISSLASLGLQWNLTETVKYRLAVDRGGAAYDEYWTGTSFPKNKTNVQFWKSMQYDAADGTSVIFSFLSVGSINWTAPLPPSNETINISFVSQTPSNITDTTLFSQNVNVTYNISTVNTTNILLNYSLTGGLSCMQFLNGTCILLNNTWQTTTWTNNRSTGNANYTFFDWILGENTLYPSVGQLNSSYYNQVHSAFHLQNNNYAISTEFLNVSTTSQYNILEVMANTTGQIRVYACNSSYAFNSNFLTNVNCQEIGTINSTGFNHSHGIYSSHNLIPFTIINGKVGGTGITATSTMYFLQRQISGSSDVYYVLNVTRTTTTKTTLDNGVTWSSEAFTADTHLHQYSNSEFFNYKSQATINGQVQNSSLISEKIDVAPLAPTPPIITNPLSTDQATRYLNITYSNASATSSGASIIYYSITLYNGDGSFNRTIVANNSLNNFYYWDVYNQNLSIGLYDIRVTAFDSQGLSSFDQESFNLTRNALINISAKRLTNGASINNFSGYVYDYTRLINVSYNTTSGNALVNIIRGDFLIFLDGDDYAIINTTNWRNLTANQPVNNITFFLYETNTVNITFYYEDTLLPVANNTLNISLDLISDLYGGNYSTSTGQLYITTLIPENYIIRYSAPGYSQRFFFVEINNKSFQTLKLYLINESTKSNITVYIIDELTNPVEGVHVKALKYDLGTNSYILQEIGVTDVTGKTILSLTKNDEYYKFMIEQDEVLKKTTEPAYITSDSLTIQITTGSTVGDEYFKYYNIWYDLTFNNNTNNFRFDYDDTNEDSIGDQYCLFVYTWTDGAKTLYNSSCLTASSGTILSTVAASNGTTYEAKAYYYVLTKPNLIDSLIYEFPKPDEFGMFGLFLQVIVTLFFAFSAFFSIAVMVIAVPFSLILGKILQFNMISWAGLIALQVTGVILAIFLSKK